MPKTSSFNVNLKMGTKPPCPDDLFKEWQVCPNLPDHLGGYCKKCEIRALTLYCQLCKSKTKPKQVFCDICIRHPRSFRTLVEWMRWGHFRGNWIEDLTGPYQKIFQTHRPQIPLPGFENIRRRIPGLQQSPPQELKFLVDSVVQLIVEEFPDINKRTLKSRLRQALFPRFSVEIESWIKKRLSPPSSNDAFYEWLLLGWCVRQCDHAHAISRTPFLSKIQELSRLCGNSTSPSRLKGFQERILDLTYVPIDIVETIPDIRKSLALTRGEESSSRRANSQQYGASPDPRSDAAQEQHLFFKFGIDKKTRSSAKQLIWTWIFVPLVLELLPYAKRKKLDRWKEDKRENDPFIPDDAFIKASQLVHLRYPDLWEDNWQRVRERCSPHLKA